MAEASQALIASGSATFDASVSGGDRNGYWGPAVYGVIGDTWTNDLRSFGRYVAGPAGSDGIVPARWVENDAVMRRVGIAQAEFGTEILRAGLAPVDIGMGGYNILTGNANLRDYLAVGGVALGSSGKVFGAVAESGAVQKLGRVFYDPRPFRTISRQYWSVNGPANGASLHHWLFPQRATFVPVGIRNAGFNLIKLPALRGVFHETLGLNQWMGLARNWGPSAARNATIVENTIRVGIPAATGGTAYGAYEAVNSIWNDK